MYKVLLDDGTTNISGCRWHLPKGKRPGKWMPAVHLPLETCVRGYHLCPDTKSLLAFLGRGPIIWEAEGRGASLDYGNEQVWEQARLLRRLSWGDREARLFACDCAERALDSWAKWGTVDPHSRATVAVARRFAVGDATGEELAAARLPSGSAAGDAAGDAVRAAAGDAAGDAVRAAVRAAAGDAVRAAAGDAVRAAAWDAVRAAAWDAERQWQAERLRQYLYGEV